MIINKTITTIGDKCPRLCNCDLDLGPTILKCILVLDIVIVNFCVKLLQNQFTTDGRNEGGGTYGQG